jgi:hypothetical protein
MRLPGKLFAHSIELHAALLQQLRSKACLLAKQPQQEVLGADMLVAQPLSLFRRVSQNALALIGQWQIDACGDFLACGCARFDLFADRLDRRMGVKKAVSQTLIFA